MDKTHRKSPFGLPPALCFVHPQANLDVAHRLARHHDALPLRQRRAKVGIGLAQAVLDSINRLLSQMIV